MNTDTMNKQAVADFQRELDSAAPQALAVVPQQPQNLLTAVERAATNPNVDVVKLRELIAIAREERAYNAEVDFNDAMVRAQGAIGRVVQDKSSDKGKYATYAALDRVVRPSYIQEGFSLSFNTGESPEASVRVLCYVSHKGGHTRTYQALIPADGKGAKGNDVMTKTHATGSAMSYGKRYLLKLIFNIAEVGDPEDDDGKGADGLTNEEQAIADWRACLASVATFDELEQRRAEFVSNYQGIAKVPGKILLQYWESALVLARSEVKELHRLKDLMKTDFAGQVPKPLQAAYLAREREAAKK